MRIAIVCDIPNWAIGHLAKAVCDYNQHQDIRMFYVHPREAGIKEVQDKFLNDMKAFDPHLIDFQYYRSAGQLLEAMPELYRHKTMLVHHNMRTKALYAWNWQNNLELKDDRIALKINQIVVPCIKSQQMLEDKGYAKNVKLVRYGFDHEFWTFSDEEPEEFTMGYAGRIVPWKGLKEIAEVAKELNIPLEMMGKQDKPDYWESVPKDNIRYNFLDCKDEERVGFFRNISVFIQNSTEGYETGTMPLMEALACGVPVITTPAGQAGDEEGLFIDGINCLKIPFNDKEALKEAVVKLKDEALRRKLRKGGWDLIKNLTEEKMARQYNDIYHDIVYPDHKLVSVIVPATYDRVENIKKIAKALTLQSYPNLELVIAWDEQFKHGSKFNRRDYDLPIKEVWTEMDKEKYPYNLAMARNLAILEAAGDVIVFNDSRLLPDENTVMMFAEAVRNAKEISDGNEKVWFFGDKGSQKPHFVENFSAVRRDLLIKAGMFCERINRYGGMTQEIRSRWLSQKGEHKYIGTAVSSEISKSGKSIQKKRDIVKSKFKLYKMYQDKRF